MKDLIRRLEDWEKDVEKIESEEKRERIWYLIEKIGTVGIIIAIVLLMHAVIKIGGLERMHMRCMEVSCQSRMRMRMRM